MAGSLLGHGAGCRSIMRPRGCREAIAATRAPTGAELGLIGVPVERVIT
jgi:hypothetical protein